MIISRIVDLSIVFNAFQYIAVTLCSEIEEALPNPIELLDSEFQSALKGISYYDSSIGLNFNKKIGLPQAIEILKRNEAVQFDDPDMTKLPVDALKYMYRIRLFRLSRNNDLNITQADIDLLKEKGLEEFKIWGGMFKIKDFRLLLTIPTLKNVKFSFCDDLSSFAKLSSHNSSLVELNVENFSFNRSNFTFDGFKTMTSIFKKLTSLKMKFDHTHVFNVPKNETIDFNQLKKTLKVLRLNSIEFDCRWLKAIGSLRTLEHLDISNNGDTIEDMTNDQIIGFGNLSNTLKSLNMDSCKVNIKWLEKICKLTNLETLSLWSNPGLNNTNLKKFNFLKLSQLKNLKTLAISKNDISQDILSKFKLVLPNVEITTEDNKIYQSL